jgi:hypothetical protein
VKIVVVSGGFVGGEDLLTKGFLHFPNKMAVLVLRIKWPQSEVLQRQLLAQLENSLSVDFFAQTQLRGIVTSSDAKSGSGTKGKVEKIEKTL